MCLTYEAQAFTWAQGAGADTKKKEFQQEHLCPLRMPQIAGLGTTEVYFLHTDLTKIQDQGMAV